MVPPLFTLLTAREHTTYVVTLGGRGELTAGRGEALLARVLALLEDELAGGAALAGPGGAVPAGQGGQHTLALYQHTRHKYPYLRNGFINKFV